MRNVIQDIKDKKLAEMKEKETQQKIREERLKELESSPKKEGFHIPNPIQAAKDKKEIKTLKKEIEAFKEAQRNKKLLIGAIIGFVLLFGFIGVMTMLEEPSIDGQDIPNNKDSIVAESENEEESVHVETESSVSDIFNETRTSEVESETEQTEEETFVPSLLASDLDVTTKTDYAHTDTEVIFLGTDEGVTISVKSDKASLTTENILLLYDDRLVSANIQEKSNGSRAHLEIYLTSKKTCETQFAILTTEEYIAYGEECEGYILDIRQLDATEGRIVYVTSTGKKFHYSKACAGDGAYETTYKDAISGGYTPCGNCVE